MSKSKTVQNPVVVNGAAGNVHASLVAVLDDMKNVLIEREDHIEAVALAVLAKQSVFLLGPPGTAKSMTVELFGKSVTGAKYFRTLAGKLSPPEQFFGPIRVTALKNDQYVRKVEGYAPTAEFVFADEVYKATSGILNGLLTLMVERMFEQDGQMQPAPLMSLFGASNELGENMAELAAFHDRFTVRLFVDRIRERANRLALLTTRRPAMTKTLTLDELKQAQAEVAAVKIPSAVASVALEIQDELFGQGLQPSDRRMQAAMGVVRAHAWLKGRSTATISDLAPLRHVFWDEPKQIQLVASIVLGKVNPVERKARDVYESMVQAVKSIERIDDEAAAIAESKKHMAEFNKAIDEIEALVAEASDGGYDAEPVQEYAAKAAELFNRVFEKYTGGLRKREPPKRVKLARSVDDLAGAGA